MALALLPEFQYNDADECGKDQARHNRICKYQAVLAFLRPAEMLPGFRTDGSGQVRRT